ncbi:MAG TPA: hypothetical protein VGU22_10220 [Methylomirabilota bacterium]|jgi:hypothetical protein|nr:hypothetical protein [Methylomirabilota bacterium]
MRDAIVIVTGVVMLGLAATTAGAEELKTPISASMFLNMTSRTEPREFAYDEALKDKRPPALRSDEGVVQPDGSVRYGKTTIVVRNPCPPGELHYEPPPLPGRRARN